MRAARGSIGSKQRKADVASLALAIILSPLAWAQREAKPEHKCIVEGVVVNSITGQPLKRAMVIAHRMIETGDPKAGQTHSAQTPANGRFILQDLSPGDYALWVNRNGYVAQGFTRKAPNNSAQTLTLRLGQHVTDVVFKLTPMGVVTGRVTDEDSEPLAGAMIQALRYGYLNGRRQLMASMTANSNDVGEYRLSGLPPGKYYVGAVYNAQGLADGTEESYVPIYYPGTQDPTAAAPVDVRAGEELSAIDLTLQPVPGVRVRGRVLNALTGQPIQGVGIGVMRREGGWSSFMRPSSISDQLGNFDLRAVPPGSYTLFGFWGDGTRQFSARTPVDVENSDVADVTLLLGPGVEIKGRLRVEGNVQLKLTGLQINLQPQEQNQPGTQSASVESDGTFVLKNVQSGTYTVSVCCPREDLFLRSGHLGSEDVLENGLTVSTTLARESLDLLLSSAGGRVEGYVQQDHRPAGATVVLVPEASRRKHPRLYLMDSAGPDGHFVLDAVPPGDYKLFAWERVEHGAYQDPDFLRRYENLGKSLRVDERSKITIELELIPFEDTPE